MENKCIFITILRLLIKANVKKKVLHYSPSCHSKTCEFLLHDTRDKVSGMQATLDPIELNRNLWTKKKSYRFGTTSEWVNIDRVFILESNIYFIRDKHFFSEFPNDTCVHLFRLIPASALWVNPTHIHTRQPSISNDVCVFLRKGHRKVYPRERFTPHSLFSFREMC